MAKIKIIPPEGYEMDTENKDPFVISFRKIEPKKAIELDYLGHHYDTYNMQTVVRMGENPDATDIARLDAVFRVKGPRGYLNYKPIREFLEDVIGPQIEEYYNNMYKQEINEKIDKT